MHKPCGIIFCKTSEVTIKIATDLRNKGVLIAPYHAGKYIGRCVNVFYIKFK